jgi:hypothetical protein
MQVDLNMGKKSTPEVPDAYKLDELLKYNTDLNRFDSENPFGTQKWSQEGDRWKMTQAVNPEFQGLIDKQLDFVNRGNQGRSMPGPMQDTYQSLMDKMSSKYGATPGYHPDVQSAAPGMGQTAQNVDPNAPEGSMMPGHAEPTPDASVADKMADALSKYDKIKGNEWASAGSAIGGLIKNRSKK